VIVRDSLLPDLACIRDENLSMLYGDCNALNLAGCEPDALRLKVILFAQLTHTYACGGTRIQSNDVFDRMDSSPKEVGQLRNEPISFEDRIALLIADTREFRISL